MGNSFYLSFQPLGTIIKTKSLNLPPKILILFVKSFVYSYVKHSDERFIYSRMFRLVRNPKENAIKEWRLTEKVIQNCNWLIFLRENSA